MTANSFADIERDLIDLRRRVDGANGVIARTRSACTFLGQLGRAGAAVDIICFG